MRQLFQMWMQSVMVYDGGNYEAFFICGCVATIISVSDDKYNSVEVCDICYHEAGLE